jgi:hypothetical protein
VAEILRLQLAKTMSNHLGHDEGLIEHPDYISLSRFHDVNSTYIITFIINIYLSVSMYSRMDREGTVGIVAGYGLDGPGSNPGGGEIFRTRPDRSWGPSSLLYNGYRVFPGGKAAGAWH